MVWKKLAGDILWVSFGLAGSVIAHFSPLGHYVRPPHKAEVSVGDRKSLFVDTRPRFAISDGVWGFFALLFQGVRGFRVYYT